MFLLVFSLLINTLLIGYGVDIGFKVKDFGNDELSLSLSYLKDKVNSYEGASFPELNQLSFKLYSAYSSLSLPETHVSYPCPKVKVIKNKALASKLGILGSYSFLTSEININPAAPTYTLVFSVAHEMAHLFGISGEAEASFYAYLASLETDDDAIAYSAALSALEYLLSEAYAQDRALFEKTYLLLSEKAKCDLREYRDFYSENHAKISVYSEMANGAFLDFADANGSKDYGDFTKLFVSYLTEEVL